MIREWFVDGLRWWFSAKGSAWLSVIAVSLAGSLLVTAQEPDAAAQNNPTAADVLSQLSDLVQSTDSPQPEDMVAPNDLAPTNGLPQADVSATGGDRTAKVNRFDNAGRSDNNSRYQGSSRSQSDDRRSRGRRSRSRFDQSGGSGSAGDYSRGSDGTNNGPITLDYASFKVIVDRNIFDPNRVPHRAGEPIVRRVPPSFDSLTLVGTMTYEKGTFAFFDGTSSEYKKALKLADAIAGYKVTNIAPTGVKLASGTNVMDLIVGAQLRREEDGPWQL